MMGTAIGQGGWGDPVASWTYSAPVANVDFANLGDFSLLLALYFDLQSNTGTTDSPAMRTSTDNGATFAATGYRLGGTATTTGLNVGAAVGPTVSLVGEVELLFFKDPTRRTFMRQAQAIEASSTVPLIRRGTRAVAEANNALRFFWNNGASFAGGSIVILGRR